MKFSRCEWTWRNLRGWSPQRIAAAKRAVTKEQERISKLRQQVALFPEMMEEIQPRFTNEAERIEIVDHGEAFTTVHTRAYYNETWRKARAEFYRLPTQRRRGCRLLWNAMQTPTTPAFFAEFVRKFSTPGNSPWTHLRKVRLIWLWNHGGWERPAHFRIITADFATLGPVTHPRVLTQSFIQIAKLRGITSRQVRKELIHRTTWSAQSYL